MQSKPHSVCEAISHLIPLALPILPLRDALDFALAKEAAKTSRTLDHGTASRMGGGEGGREAEREAERGEGGSERVEWSGPGNGVGVGDRRECNSPNRRGMNGMLNLLIESAKADPRVERGVNVAHEMSGCSGAEQSAKESLDSFAAAAKQGTVNVFAVRCNRTQWPIWAHRIAFRAPSPLISSGNWPRPRKEGAVPRQLELICRARTSGPLSEAIITFTSLPRSLARWNHDCKSANCRKYTHLTFCARGSSESMEGRRYF